jgi:hypothetical protein
MPFSTVFCNMSLEFLNKSPPNKKEISFEGRTEIGGHFHSPALLGISFRIPSKGALPAAAVLRSASNFPTRQMENMVIPKQGIKSEMDV